jgi:hypothetical protein
MWDQVQVLHHYVSHGAGEGSVVLLELGVVVVGAAGSLAAAQCCVVQPLVV